MRAPMKATVLMAVMVLFSFGLAQGQAVFVNTAEVVGLDANGEIPEAGTDLTIPVRFTNAGDARTAISNGYYFFGDGMAATVDTAMWNPAYPWNNFLAYTVHMCYPPVCYAWFEQGDWWTRLDRGLGGFGIAALTGGDGPGMPADFDDVAYTFTLSGVVGPKGAVLTMDTTYWEPGNFWLWSGVGDQVSWGGPYDFVVAGGGGCEVPYTTCYPQPVELKVNDNDRVLEVTVFCEDVPNVDLASVRIGNIPCYTNDGVAYDLGDGSFMSDAFIMRFLGSSGLRPLDPNGIITTYTVSYDLNGVNTSLEGEFLMNVNQGDVTFDGNANLEDIIFMTEHLFGGGPSCHYEEYPVDELMDFDQSGRFDLLDVNALLRTIF